MSPFLICVQILCLYYGAHVFLCYWNLYRLYYPIACRSNDNRCLKNYVAKTPHPPLKLWVYSSTSQSPNGSDLYPVWELNDFNPNENFTKDVTVRIPLGMHKNGTMFVHVFLTPAEEGRGEENPFDADWGVNQTGILTQYAHHQATKLQINSDNPVEKQELATSDQLTCHWRSHLTLNVMTDDVSINRKAIPNQIWKFLWPYEDQYLPVLLIDDLIYRTKDLLPLNNTCKEMPLTISYTPTSYGTFSLWMVLKEFINWENSGMTEKEIIYLKEVFITNLPFFLRAGILVLLCRLFDYVAIERDVSFWQERQTTAGLSTQTVVWRSISILVFILQMMNERENGLCRIEITFLSVLCIVEVWKVLKIFQLRFHLTEWRLVFDNVVVGDRERETQAHDSQAMRYLSCVLYPSWVAVIIYTVMYNLKKSWYSLCIQSLFNGFYFFGSLYMLPQVFINYKLKSVADLPWMVLMFRAFSSIIMTICRFVIMDPIDGGGACFLDDVIFVIYLYQRWLYSH